LIFDDTVSDIALRARQEAVNQCYSSKAKRPFTDSSVTSAIISAIVLILYSPVMVKSTLYTTVTVLPGNRIEIQDPDLTVGQTVEVVILVQEVTPDFSTTEEQSPSLEQRLAFLKLPIDQRRHILKSQAEIMLSHYQQNSEWQELMAGDVIDY